MATKTKEKDKPQTAPGKAVIPTGNSPPPALANQFAQYSRQGFEGTNSDDFLVPFIKILQSTSPEVKDGEAAYIKEARPGMFLNTATGRLYKYLHMVPCAYQRLFVEWKPRDEGGGYKGRHMPGSDVVRGATRDEDDGSLTIENGNTLQDTRYFYGLAADGESELGEDEIDRVVFPLKSTQIKKARGWMTRMDAIRLKGSDGKLFAPPMFSHSWKLKTILERNDQGSWYGLAIEGEPTVISDENLFSAALAFHELVSSGKTKIADEGTREPGDETGDGKIPF